MQAPFLGACCQSGPLSRLAPDFLMHAENTTPTNSPHGGHFGWLPWALTVLGKRGSIAIMEPEAEPRRSLKGPSP